MHQFLAPDHIKPCCNFGEMFTGTPDEYWQSDFLKNIRERLEQNIWPVGCRSCKDNELAGIPSLRQQSLKEYIKPAQPVVEFVDFRLSNKCNFACRTCEPNFSTRIATEAINNNLSEFYAYIPSSKYVRRSTAELKNILPTVKRAMFTGGEPTILQEFYDVLELLPNDIELQIVTNCSNINNKFLDSIEYFEKKHITLSIDAIGDVAEYIRYGTLWREIEQGIKSILDLKCSVVINSVISAYSLPYLDKLVKFVLDNEQEQYSIHFVICNNPDFLHPSIYKDRTIIIDIIDKCVDLLYNSNRVEDYQQAIYTLIGLKHLLKTNPIVDDSKFLAYTNRLDTIRNQTNKQYYWHTI